MDETPKTRRTYTEDERLARLDSQRQMILDRAAKKRRERIAEAAMLIRGLDEVASAHAELVRCLDKLATDEAKGARS